MISPKDRKIRWWGRMYRVMDHMSHVINHMASLGCDGAGAWTGTKSSHLAMGVPPYVSHFTSKRPRAGPFIAWKRSAETTLHNKSHVVVRPRDFSQDP